MAQKEKIDVTAFIDGIKKDYSLSVNEKIWDLNKILKPFLFEYVDNTIEQINQEIKKQFNSVAPQFVVFSNVDSNLNEIDTFFIQISYRSPDAEYNPLTSPFLVMEFNASGSANFLTSNFRSIEKVNEITDMFNLQHEELQNKFISSLEHLLRKIYEPGKK